MRTPLPLVSLVAVLVAAHPAHAQTARGFTIVAERNGTSLMAQPRERGPENTDVQLPREFVVVTGGVERAQPTPVLAGALFAGGVAWVTVTGALWVERPSGTIEILEQSGVISELAVSPNGVLAYVKQPGTDGGVFVFDGERSRCVTVGLMFADRPLFMDDVHLVVVGAAPGGIAGVHVVRIDGSEVRGVTNQGMRTGRPFGAAFVPPPADHASMHMDGHALEYFDGRTTQRVDLVAGVRR